MDMSEQTVSSWTIMTNIDEDSKVRSSPDGRILCIWTKDKENPETLKSNFIVQDLGVLIFVDLSLL